MYHRHITRNLLDALKDTPVVVIQGGRQTGKSTLARHLAAGAHPAEYLTLDRTSVLSAATNDPEGFLANTTGPVVIDEVQRAPGLILAIKAFVDRDRRPGRFLLTGSANVLQLPKLADSLAGRMELHTLRPLSQGEIEGRQEGFIDALFAAKLPTGPKSTSAEPEALGRKSLAHRILVGGYPEAFTRKGHARRREWFESYLSSTVLRDVKELTNIAKLADMPRLLIAIAGRAGGLLNYAELGRDVGLNQVTTKNYMTLLQMTFIVQTVPPWYTNRIKRVAKSEKVYLADTGLLGHLLDVAADRFGSNPKTAGALLENFVAVELLKQASWSKTRPTLWHFRDHQGNEVDFVLEGPGGRKLVGIDVKSTATLSAADFKGLRLLAEAGGDRFHRGIVLYTGAEVIPFGRKLYALPITNLWCMAATQ